MVPQFAQQAQSSFLLWFDHHLLDKGQAFSNKTGQFYYSADTRLPSPYRSFSSQYKQWVGDSSISGATIPSGVFVGANFSGRANNVILDFNNGRVIASGLSTGAVPTGAFAVKEFNIYTTNENLEDLIVEKKYIERPKIGSDIAKSGVAPYQPMVPAIFINAQNQENEPFAFGGEDTTTINFSATVLCENSFQLDSVLGLFADTNNKTIPLVPFTGTPYTEFWDLKGGSYNYNALTASSTELPMYIERVRTAKITDKARKAIENNLYIGLLDFEVSKVRYPRV